jgi:hypothetical protein
MNRKQSAVILIGAVVLVLMGLFPPWRYTEKRYYHLPRHLIQVTESQHYRFVFADPSRRGAATGSYLAGYEITDMSVRMDATRLVAQWAVVVITAGALVFALRTKPARSP